MDPNAALRDLREALREYEHAGELPAIALAAERLHSAASALDEWLSQGGFLPAAWVRPQEDDSADDDILDTITAGNRAALEASGLESGWDDHPTFPRADWAAEIANGDTWLGYPQWVAAREFDMQDAL